MFLLPWPSPDTLIRFKCDASSVGHGWYRGGLLVVFLLLVTLGVYMVSITSPVSAGDFHTCLVKADGPLACWKDNSSRQAAPPIRLQALQNVLRCGDGGCVYWNPSTPSSNVSGYQLYYGLSPGSYRSNVDVGNQTRYWLDGLPLQIGSTYYIVVKAYGYDDNGQAIQSGFSNEMLYCYEC